MSTQPSVIPFAEWTPDLPEYNNPGALIALNVIPQLQSYRSLNSLQAFSNALADVCLGTFWTQDDNNVVFNFAGDDNALYRLDGGVTWTDITRTVGGAYTAENWDFTKFGERVIAVNIADEPQYYDLSTSTEFEDLPGSPPNAARIATVRDFLVLGDIASLGPNFIQWSGYNDSEAWTPSIRTQSDFQELFGRGGRVQRIVPGEFGIIFTEQSIWRMDYVGPPVIFQLDEVERKRGTPAPNSVIWTGEIVYFFGWDGFYAFDGVRSQPISHNRTSRWFQENADPSVYGSMRGAVDRLNRLLIWAFKSSASSPCNDRLIIYNWAADKWSYAELETQTIDEYVAPGFSLDALDGPLPLGIDLDSIPVDSTQFAGGAINLQAFDATNQAATFDGTPLAATLDTKEISGPNHKRIMTNSVRPLVEGTVSMNLSVQVGRRNGLRENVDFTLPRATNGLNGEVNLRENSRYQRFRVNITDGFDDALGVKVSQRISGGRR